MLKVFYSCAKEILFIVLLFFSTNTSGQNLNNLGAYTIRNYTAKSYGMHPRNTYVTQDQRGILYFGNHYGVINYDGNYWGNTHLPNGTSAYSITLGHDKKMYVGCYNDLGFIAYDAVGQSTYLSLLDLLPSSEKNFGEIWKIVSAENATLFFSNSKILVYKNNGIQIIKPTEKGNQFQFAQKVGQDIFVNESNKGLFKLTEQGLTPIESTPLFKSSIIKAIVPIHAKQWLIVESKKIYLFEGGEITSLSGNINNLIALHECTHAIQLADKNILLATKDNGIYIISQTGQIIKNITIDNGLQSNNILYAYLDDKNNIWLALDNGIAYIEMNSPFSFIGHANGMNGMGFSAARFKDKLYLATSQGLFYKAWDEHNSKNAFKNVKGIDGQVWSLSIVNNTLVCCHAHGTSQIEDDVAIPLVSKRQTNNWKFTALIGHPNYAIKGTEKGFELYLFQNDTWNFVRTLDGFSESCRVFVEDTNNIIWVCHGNKGLYKLKLSNDLLRIEKVNNISTEQNFAADFFLDVSIVNKHVAIASQEGVYTINYTTNKIIKDVALEKILGANLYINKIAQFEDNNIWVFLEDGILLYKKTKLGSYDAVSDVLHKLSGNLVGSYEFVMPLNKEYSIIGSQEGFVLFNMSNRSIATPTPYATIIRKVEANFKNDSLLFGGNYNVNNVTTLNQSNISTWSYNFNSLRISYSALFYESTEKITYQYTLQPTKENQIHWSGWTSNTQVVLSNLSEGDYTFHVRSKNIYGQLSAEGTYRFHISPPWYRSLYAYLFYILIMATSIFCMARIIRNRFKTQRLKLESEKETELKLLEQEFLTEIIRKEKEIVTIKNEQLEDNVMRKKNELASLATNLNQKTELLIFLKEKFKSLNNNPTADEDNQLKEVIKTIDQQFLMDDNWAKFQSHFDEMHHNFLQRLQENYPKLDQSWLLLCAYIRMNKSNKEMATLLNISVAAVEKRRYRLKDKLELDNESKLVDFILTY